MIKFYWKQDLSMLAFKLNKYNSGNLYFYGLSVKQFWVGFISWKNN